MGIILRSAAKSDMAAVVDLVKELAVFENEPDAVEVTENELVRDGFGENPRFKIFLAEENDEHARQGILLRAEPAKRPDQKNEQSQGWMSLA